VVNRRRDEQIAPLRVFFGQPIGVACSGLADWFWRDTTAGQMLSAIQEVCKQSGVPGRQEVAHQEGGLTVNR